MSESPATMETGSWDVLARAAADRSEGEESIVLQELLAFGLGGDLYALPVERVREIVRLRPITPVPRVPREILGVISLRGEIVQVMDLSLRLGAGASEPTRRSRIIVLHGDEGEVASLLVDTVSEVLRVSDEAFRPNSSGESEFVAELCERDGAFVSMLSLEKVLSIGD